MKAKRWKWYCIRCNFGTNSDIEAELHYRETGHSVYRSNLVSIDEKVKVI